MDVRGFGRERQGSLIGRDRELSTLTDALATHDGSLRLVTVEGEAGIGKTSVVRHAVGSLEATVLWASADDAELNPDLAVVDQLIRSAPLPRDERRALWARAGADPIAAGEALIVLLGRLSDEAPGVVVVVDDAHWADAASLYALAFAVRRLRADPVAVCLVVRTEERDCLPESVGRLLVEEGSTVRVPPLDAQAVHRLAETVRSEPVTAGAAARLADHTGGNPLYLIELVTEASPEALVSRGELPAPRSFASAIGGRFTASATATRALAAAVAVVGRRVGIGVAGRIAAVDDALDALDRATAEGFVAVVDRTAPTAELEVESLHPLVRAAILGCLPPSQRSALHRRAGAVLGGLESLVHRLMAAIGADEALWHEAASEARALSDRGSHGAAADLLRLARGVAPSAELAERALLGGIDELLLAGRLREAASRYDEVRAGMDSAHHHYVLARMAYVLGPRADTETHLRHAWDALDPADGDQLAGEVAALMATQAIDRGAADDAVGWAEVALARAPERAARLSSAHQLAAGHGIRGTLDAGLDDLTARLEAVLRVGASPPVVADVRCARGLLRMWRHDPAGAAEDLRQALADAERGASLAARESTRTYLGEALYRIGAWDEALRLAQRSASTADATEEVWLTGSPDSLLSRLVAARGSPEASRYARRHLDACLAIGSPVGALLAQLDLIEVSVSLGDLSTAASVGDEASVGGARLVAEHFAPWRANYVEALVAAGRADAARSFAAELAADSPAPRVQNDAARAWALIAGTSDPDGFDEAAATGLGLDPEAVGPYPRARLELVVGREWRRRGDRRRAEDVLTAARSRFQALRAAPWLDLVERELGATGRHRSRRGEAPASTLTAREQVVAELVSRGLSNQQVGAELIISPKTVEHHLGRIYVKLGVRTRTELAHRFAATGG